MKGIIRKAMIEILLATYNSEKYLREQIDSIIEQNCDNWKLLIRDGGSSDSTLGIINEYCLSYPEKIKLIASNKRSTAVENFSTLLETSSAPYIMFADHDDIWLKDKVSKSSAKMKESEELFGADTPLLIFTDKYVVDSNLNNISNSYFKYQKLDPSRTALNYLLTQNIPSGCTMLINRPLLDLIGQIPSTAVMHDHWLSLVAAAFGKIVYLDKSTLYYRQHNNNFFGASKYGIKYLTDKFCRGKKQLRERFFRNVDQGAAFLTAYGSKIPPGQVKMLEDFVSLKNCSGIKAYYKLIKHRIFKNGVLRNLGMFYILL